MRTNGIQHVGAPLANIFVDDDRRQNISAIKRHGWRNLRSELPGWESIELYGLSSLRKTRFELTKEQRDRRELKRELRARPITKARRAELLAELEKVEDTKTPDLAGRRILYRGDAETLLRHMWAAAAERVKDGQAKAKTLRRLTWERPKTGIPGVRYLMVPALQAAMWAERVGISVRQVFRILAQLRGLKVIVPEGRVPFVTRRGERFTRTVYGVAHPIDMAKFWSAQPKAVGPSPVCPRGRTEYLGENDFDLSYSDGGTGGGVRKAPSAPSEHFQSRQKPDERQTERPADVDAIFRRWEALGKPGGNEC